MSNDLKTENNRTIFLILTASLVFSAGFQVGFSTVSNISEMLVAGTGSLILSAILVMVANILPQSVKHKLVFTRFKDELPAGRIDEICKRDARIEFDVVKNQWPEVFSEAIDSATRNTRWYQQIYKPVKDADEVLQAHRSFLLYRDVFSGLVLILMATIIWSWFGDAKLFGEIKPVVFYVQGILMFLSLIAARVAGNRFVVNAIAVAVAVAVAH